MKRKEKEKIDIKMKGLAAKKQDLHLLHLK